MFRIFIEIQAYENERIFGCLNFKYESRKIRLKNRRLFYLMIQKKEMYFRNKNLIKIPIWIGKQNELSLVAIELRLQI